MSKSDNEGSGSSKALKVNSDFMPKLVLSEIPLNVILKFIKPYDGSREKLNAFINNCSNAISLTSVSQESIVLKYIISQLEGKAELACSIKEFSNWTSLQDFLKAQFGERKHHAHLLSELQDCRQTVTESVSQFSLRIESCLSQLLTEVTMSCSKKMELPGRLAAMQDLALNSFIMGVNPKISMILRCKSPKTLNEAINIAISEDKLQQYSNKKPVEILKQGFPKKAYFPGNPRPGTSNYNNQPNSFNRPKTSSNTPVVCRYCKIPGHTLEQCRKREYNNRRFNFNNNASTRPINFLENNEGVDETDSSSLNEM
jgi:hypothetical protein